METAPHVAPGIRRLTVNLDDTDLDLFEEIWPIPQGIALHSWLVQGKKSILIDPWDAGGYGPEELAVDLAELGLSWNAIDAVAFTRTPDHGTVARLLAARPGLEILGAPGGAVYDLGNGLRLEPRGPFWFLPGVGAVFTGRQFAGLGWIEEEIFAEDLKEDEVRFFDGEALRWYAGRPEAVGVLPEGVRLVLPAHGCAGRDPQAFVARAQRFEAWGTGEALDEVTVVWPDGAGTGVDALVGGALELGAGLNLFRVPGDDPTALAAGARRASLVVVAEGLDDGFLRGLNKDVWRPKATLSEAELRAGLVRRWTEGA